MKALSVLLKEQIDRRGISTRQAGEEIGISHTTIPRIIDGDVPSLSTFLAICRWLGVNPSTLIDEESTDPAHALASRIEAVLETDPQLARLFEEAMQRVLDGRMLPQTFREFAAYAAVRLNIPDLGAEYDTNKKTKRATRSTTG